MKINDNDMESILRKYGFNVDDSGNIWTRGLWTVRFFENVVEIFDDVLEGGEGKYLLGDRDLLDLEAVLEDIKD
jgi:hypothetical protein